MRDDTNDKPSRFYFLELAGIATVALLFTVSLTPHQGAPTAVQSPAAPHDIAPTPLESALDALDGVTHHG